MPTTVTSQFVSQIFTHGVHPFAHAYGDAEHPFTDILIRKWVATIRAWSSFIVTIRALS